MENLKSAILFGATGLVGGCVLAQLLKDARYSEVSIFLRRSTGIKHPKLSEFIVDFSKPETFRDKIKGDDFFCCLGTTIKTAGSQEAFLKIDFELVKWCAETASANGVKNFLVISSLGAAAESYNFYYKTKGEMEKAVNNVKFEKHIIFRPSMLLGKRKEFRLFEMIGKVVMVVFSFLVPAKYKAIKAEVVAKAMIKAANDKSLNGVIESDAIRLMN